LIRNLSTPLSAALMLSALALCQSSNQPGVTRRTVAVTVSPATAGVRVGGTLQYAASVTGTSVQTVTWSLSPAVGVISSAGLYTAPASLSTPINITVIARSTMDTTKSATAALVVSPAIGLSVSPSSGTVQSGQTLQINATVTGASNPSVLWSIASGAGTVSSSGVYTAPAGLSAQTSAIVRATSVADTTKRAEASLTVVPDVQVSVTPGTASLPAGGNQQFSAAVSGTTNQGVVWTISPPVGTISSRGLYKPPTSISTPAAVTVRATSIVDTAKSGTAAVTIQPAPAVSVLVTPTTASVNAGGSVQLGATVSGSTNTGVTWNVSPAVGTVSASGLYVAPASVPAATVVSVRAVSVADPAKSAAASVTVNPAAISVSVTPGTASISAGGSLALSASVTGSANTGVVWSVSPAIGAVSSSGNTAVYAAPGALTQTSTVEVRATSLADSMKFSKATLSLIPALTMAVTPAQTVVQAGQSKQFQASFSGGPSQPVVWSVEPAGAGTVSQLGYYTAPLDLIARQRIRVKATTSGTPTLFSTSDVDLEPVSALSFTLNNKGLETVLYKGVDYNLKYGESLLSYIWYTAPDGRSLNTVPNCTGRIDGNAVEQDCTALGSQFKVRVVYERSSSNTLCADVYLTNLSPQGYGATVSTLGVRYSSFDASKSLVTTVGRGTPLAMLTTPNMRIFSWLDTPDVDASLVIGASSTSCKNQLGTGLPGNGTTHKRYCLRFSEDMTSQRNEIVPEAFQKYAQRFPSVLDWPDRRPVMAWWLADTGKRSTLNPRGYLQDANLDASNSSLFRQRMIQAATNVKNAMDGRPVRPQGIVLWDLEGQEFNHALTYIGDPRVFESGYAPEMNAVADDVYRIFRDAGYKVGLTIRPQKLDWGTMANRPATCTSNAMIEWRDMYVAVDQPFPNKYFECTARDTWTLFPYGHGTQFAYERKPQNDPVILELLRSKIEYARQRWQVTIFYIDSAVYTGGAPLNAEILRTLRTEFPDCLLIPEQENLDTMSAAIPFADPRNSLDPIQSPISWRWVYPDAAIAIKLSDRAGTCWDQRLAAFRRGQMTGDIALYSQPFQMNQTQLTTIENMILGVRSEMSSITVTDQMTGSTYRYQGNAVQPSGYPLKMRVYFAGSAEGLQSSDLYCEAGQLFGGNTCTLPLAGNTHSQIRYVSFSNELIASEPAQTLSQ